MRSRGFWLWSALALLRAVPAVAGFNDLLQVICDRDNVVTTGCSATPDGLEFVHSVAVSPDGKHVYVCSSLADNPVSDPGS